MGKKAVEEPQGTMSRLLTRLAEQAAKPASVERERLVERRARPEPSADSEVEEREEESRPEPAPSQSARTSGKRIARAKVESSKRGEAATITRKVRFTPTEAEKNGEVVKLLSRLTRTKPSESGVTRVLWSLLRDAEDQLKQQGRRGVELYRPANGPSIEMAAYERELARFILEALKSLEI